ncbi:MAG: S-adenosylhomocysteine deaminase [Deltaproteobacteria bacterium]|nr:MAG: S-adenosylhomocysteine deaminase [Deltaproteobacteria bacterium]
MNNGVERLALMDIVIKNGTILTMDPENRVYEKGFLGVTGDTISHVGTDGSMPPHGKKVIDARGGLVLPGLVNGHTHAAMTLFRGLADDLPLMDWLNNYIFPVESRMDADFVYTGSLLACAEMIMSGTTSFCDMYLFEQEVARAAHEAGMRCIVGEVLYDFDSPNYGSVENGLKYTEELIRQWSEDPLVSVAVEPHSLFTCSPELLGACHDLARRYGVPLITHVAETRAEMEEIQSKYGKTPFAHLDSLGMLGPHLVADHCVHLDHQDMELIINQGVKVIHNPESNMKLASGVAPVPEMIARGITVGLGTDGCASNNNLDLFTEMDTAAKLHKVHNMDTTVMDAVTVFRMATIEGAKALGLDQYVGSLEVGKKADIIILDTCKPHLTPLFNPFSHIVYAARGNDVSHTLINGKIVMENRRVKTFSLPDIFQKVENQANRVRRWIGK